MLESEQTGPGYSFPLQLSQTGERGEKVASACMKEAPGLCPDPLILRRQGTSTEKIPPSFSEMSSGVVTRQKGI